MTKETIFFQNGFHKVYQLIDYKINMKCGADTHTNLRSVQFYNEIHRFDFGWNFMTNSRNMSQWNNDMLMMQMICHVALD